MLKQTPGYRVKCGGHQGSSRHNPTRESAGREASLVNGPCVKYKSAPRHSCTTLRAVSAGRQHVTQATVSVKCTCPQPRTQPDAQKRRTTTRHATPGSEQRVSRYQDLLPNPTRGSAGRKAQLDLQTPRVRSVRARSHVHNPTRKSAGRQASHHEAQGKVTPGFTPAFQWVPEISEAPKTRENAKTPAQAPKRTEAGQN